MASLPRTATARHRSYLADPSALPETIYTGPSSGIWKAHPDYDWRQLPVGTGLGWITACMVARWYAHQRVMKRRQKKELSRKA